jgi:uncharacterized protein YgbK (DUF1537 family)
MAKPDLLLAFYGDDITGSTDALEGLARNGVPSVLFVTPPSPADLERFDDVRAVGVAGTSRAMSPAEMGDELPSVFEALADLDPPLVHYKVCSTFDSSPEVGSIGTAIDIGQSVYDSPFVPVSQGTTSPHGRYVVFGNLFAEQDGTPYRLDRHPTMRAHPRTPMHESDIRRHLGEQTSRPIGLVDIRHVESHEDVASSLERTVGQGDEIVVFDALDAGHLETIGGVLWSAATERQGVLFCVGSSGLEHDALPAHWERADEIDPAAECLTPRPLAEPILVMSGSVAPTTASQVEHAAAAGFETMRLDTSRLVDPAEREPERRAVVQDAVSVLESGTDVVLYTARGPDDPAVERTRRRFEDLGPPGDLGDRLGRQQGLIVEEILRKVGLERACVAGGDTSGAVISELGITALEAISVAAPGAPLCRAVADRSFADGLEIAFKGGQTGGDDYFSVVKAGGVSPD